MAERIQEGATWKCSACGGFVRSDAPHCKHCKVVFEGEGIAVKAAPTQRKIHPLLVLGILLLIIVAGLYWFVSTGPPIENMRGQLVGGGDVLAARDLSTFDKLVGMAPADLLSNPSVLLLPDGTDFVVLEVHVPRSRVRLTEGEYAGQEVWVSTVMTERR